MGVMYSLVSAAMTGQFLITQYAVPCMHWVLVKNRAGTGFRASARTMLVDELDIDYNVIEANLAHAVKDANGRSYNRTQYVKQRFVMIQQWADYLDKLATGGGVIHFKVA